MYSAENSSIHSPFKNIYFFWVIPQCLNFICRRFGTLCLHHLHRQVDVKNELGLRNVGVFIWEKVWLRLFSSQTFSCVDTPTFLKPSSFCTPTCLWRGNRQCSETSAYKIQTSGITQQKAYNIQNTAKVWNQEYLSYCLSRGMRCQVRAIWVWMAVRYSLKYCDEYVWTFRRDVVSSRPNYMTSCLRKP